MSANLHVQFNGVSSDLEPAKMRLVSGNYFSTLAAGTTIGRVLNSG